jgi:methionine biosynthesis protein MetW
VIDHSNKIVKGRPDYEAIAEWIPKGANVLDLGCGDGGLLKFLKEARDIRGYGVEISDSNILSCIANGVNVIQGDLEAGLADFESNSFDYVMLSQTLQATKHTEQIIREMLRVGREGIVSFPNFGHWKNRLSIARGNMPVSVELPYQWYDTPNVHLCTLHDFEEFCVRHRVKVLERRVMAGRIEVKFMPNLLGSTAVYRFRRAEI